jgi:hypothetical protein
MRPKNIKEMIRESNRDSVETVFSFVVKGHAADATDAPQP